MGTNCAHLVADLFLFCYERETMMSLSWSTTALMVRLARHETGLSPPVKYFSDRSKAGLLLWIIYVISFLFLLCFRVSLFIDALWSPAGKGLSPWLSFVMSNCEVVAFPLVSWVRCGAWLYRFMTFTLFLTLYCLPFVFEYLSSLVLLLQKLNGKII